MVNWEKVAVGDILYFRGTFEARRVVKIEERVHGRRVQGVYLRRTDSPVTDQTAPDDSFETDPHYWSLQPPRLSEPQRKMLSLLVEDRQPLGKRAWRRVQNDLERRGFAATTVTSSVRENGWRDQTGWCEITEAGRKALACQPSALYYLLAASEKDPAGTGAALWWRSAYRGFTVELEDAGLFRESEALKFEAEHAGTIAVPAAEARTAGRTRVSVDKIGDYIRRGQAEAAQVQETGRKL